MALNVFCTQHNLLNINKIGTVPARTRVLWGKQMLIPKLRAKLSHIKEDCEEEGWPQVYPEARRSVGGDLSGPVHQAGLTEELGIGEALQAGEQGVQRP